MREFNVFAWATVIEDLQRERDRLCDVANADASIFDGRPWEKRQLAERARQRIVDTIEALQEVWRNHETT